MSTPNPLVPQGMLPDKGKSHVRIAVFTILAIHVVLLCGLLILGCKKTTEPLPGGDFASDTNMFPPLPPPTLAPPAPDTNLPPLPATPLPPDTQTVETPVVSPPPVVTPPPVLAPEPAPTAGTEHVVVKNDSFSSLAKKYGVSVRAIAEANPGVDSSRLKIGQKLRIPAPTAARSTPAVNGGATVEGFKIYTVKSGDNLTKIANAHGVRVKELRTLNGLRTDQLKVGQKLKIPSKTPPAPVPTPMPEAPATLPPPPTSQPLSPPPAFPGQPGPGNP